MSGWIADGLPTVQGGESLYDPDVTPSAINRDQDDSDEASTKYQATFVAQRYRRFDDIVRNLSTQQAQVVDARSADRYVITWVMLF
jgi:3-mercaptopyruvate sulfurtransferase SseA